MVVLVSVLAWCVAAVGLFYCECDPCARGVSALACFNHEPACTWRESFFGDWACMPNTCSTCGTARATLWLAGMTALVFAFVHLLQFLAGTFRMQIRHTANVGDDLSDAIAPIRELLEERLAAKPATDDSCGK